MRLLWTLVTFAAHALALSPPASRTSPPSGALIVRAGTTTSGEYKDLASAVAALPSGSSSQTIFIYPGRCYARLSVDVVSHHGKR